jgi:hypothetical protein
MAGSIADDKKRIRVKGNHHSIAQRGFDGESAHRRTDVCSRETVFAAVVCYDFSPQGDAHGR